MQYMRRYLFVTSWYAAVMQPQIDSIWVKNLSNIPFSPNAFRIRYLGTSINNLSVYFEIPIENC